ncbi:MAG TPA: alpha/beta fold hydrolase, partial [Guyparkeria sp.]|nr:alpha/beta fold hydrolase [Guyparkeria sp.]
MPTRAARWALLLWTVALPAAGAGFSTPAERFTPSGTLAGETLRYHVMGPADGPVAIVLGGGPGFSSWNLEPVQRRLAELGYRAALMDMLGVGENASTDRLLAGDALLDTWVEQTAALRREVAGERPVVLLGHSWGALMALMYTREHRSHVRRLVLLNPVDPERHGLRHIAEQIDERRDKALSQRWDREAAWEQTWQQAVAPDGPMAGDQHYISRSLPSYFLDYEQGQRYAAQFDATDFVPELNVEGWRAYGMQPLRYQTIRDWGIPIDFIGCQRDLLMPASLEAMRAGLSFERVTLLSDCVHFPWEEV